MTFAELVALALVQRGVTDIFGIPGAVLLDFLYTAAEKNVRPRISYNEQSAAFAACGYAQAASYGCAFATKGPGATNLLTGMADAYCEGARVLFLTAHGGRALVGERRLATNQEVDVVAMAAPVALVSERADTVDGAVDALMCALTAMDAPRGGPAFLDIHASLWSSEVPEPVPDVAPAQPACEDAAELDAQVRDFVAMASRPVVLVGQGARTADPRVVRAYLASLGAPIVCSRPALDVACGLPHAYGYVGSRGIRAANRVLAQASHLLVLGNRMGFPDASTSFRPLVDNVSILRLDADPAELARSFGGQVRECDLRAFFLAVDMPERSDMHAEWLAACDRTTAQVAHADVTPPVADLMRLLEGLDERAVLAVDIGNNSHWLSIAAHELGLPNHQLHSHSFGALGSALGRAIGAALAGAPHVVCTMGDQGLQMNSQELQLVRDLRLPITIVVMNNHTSGMIRDRQLDRDAFLLTTSDSGYGVPDLASLAAAYGLPYARARDLTRGSGPALTRAAAPLVVEVYVDGTIEAQPNLPAGAPLDQQTPPLEQGAE
ncbi:thiamine pyrophosphate-binding protein [Denitrobacterium detoxificans]|jgi:acetolactate synthase-1/2/3 large subunit|uniref:thiamine pyrophosphate-binding protein n=1 Tax=Denitrobacterium detoxificans TaxID=79604 RepID=UPI0026ECEC1F|nr:thiamine pyrophosphate-binding protein [Denitrobacterium detoxificans]